MTPDDTLTDALVGFARFCRLNPGCAEDPAYLRRVFDAYVAAYADLAAVVG